MYIGKALGKGVGRGGGIQIGLVGTTDEMNNRGAWHVINDYLGIDAAGAQPICFADYDYAA